MSLSEFEQKRYERLAKTFLEKRRPPPQLRAEFDLEFRFSGQSIEIFEVRPRWNKPEEKIEQAIAKATYVKAQNIWKVFWQRADLKWHRYDPVPAVGSLEKFFELVDEDKYGCFFG